MKYILILTVLIYADTYSQSIIPKSKADSSFVFSNYETFDYKNEGHKVRKLLNEGTSALIIDMQYNRYISMKNNEIIFYTRCEDSLINTITLSKEDKLKCEILIDALVKINPEKLIEADTTQKSYYSHYDKDTSVVSISKGGKILKLITSHGNNWQPKYTFPEVREKFSKSYLNLRNYFYDEEFERVKSLDTIYLYVERGKEIQLGEISNKERNTFGQQYLWQFKCTSGIFMSVNLKSFSEPADVFYRDKTFLKTNSSKIISMNYLKKFNNYDLNQLINSNIRKVFIIDKDEISDEKLKIKEVKVGVFNLYY
ncbi:hypothetical protein [Flavobacterium tegetincola]|uniref:hypothetical protein n=1 Tax=Flavobacterium tegetincola TaxID=150172 RepID=UPI0003FAD104|nr:hypothetical protein [Flavobacterium tegetincola]